MSLQGKSPRIRIIQSGRNLMRRHYQQFSCASLTMYYMRYFRRRR
ncbi:hypothetical protein Goari_027452 [Gossypium aridum]|uniref:Uncharacterized protein n=1 Tax=Gossypium aridum TaxID=34290 RepID=A0A7J8YPY1_GOSAI|nr:hypothetical protein [Gossypium aridum]